MMLVVAQISDKAQLSDKATRSHKPTRRESLVWPFLLVSGFALFGSFVFAQRSFALAFLFLVAGAGCMFAPYGPFFAIVPERLPSGVSGEVLALINTCGAFGGFFGSYFVGFLQDLTGNSRAGFLLMSLSLIASALPTFCLPPAKLSSPIESERVLAKDG
jgi:nitrate/nitrite transporter NarK